MMYGYNKGSTETAKKIPKGSHGVEIGVWRGDTTEKFIKNAETIIAVDPWSIKGNEDPNRLFERYKDLVGADNIEDFEPYYDDVHAFVCKRFRKQKGITVKRMTSQEFFDWNTKTDFDWVYVDGLHSHEGCYNDLVHCWDIIKKGGTMFGDDYPNKSGVVSAVDQFVKERNLKLHRFANNQWYIER